MSRQSQGQGDIYDNPSSKVRYEAYSRLQAAAVAFGEQLPIPEIVAIGGQSDGKSSLLEAFLGVSRMRSIYEQRCNISAPFDFSKPSILTVLLLRSSTSLSCPSSAST